jgi:hypothetical protein
MRFYTYIAVSLFGFLLILSSCKKEQLLSSGGELRYSTDTLTFDTVFTELGSFTMGLKIFNPQNQKVNISSVRLEKGNSSFFHLNVNGFTGNNISNIEVAANDSIYVFATVRINPDTQNLPFIVEDKLIATLNGEEYSIPVFAYGQNAHFIRDSVITKTDTWLTDKPYVILHSALVEKGTTLTIPPGCRVYMHADSRLYVRGTLRCGVGGTEKDTVIFQGNRLDRDYFGNEGYPGEWGGIYFDSSSSNNIIEWTTLKNCGNNSGGGLPFAIEVFNTDLTMNNCVIQNAIGYGILSFHGNIAATNCLVNDCGAQALAIFEGGTYSFTNCDFLNYFPKKVAHSDNPTVAVLNYLDLGGNQFRAGGLEARFRYCLIYGSLDDELVCDSIDVKGAVPYSLSFDTCLIKSKEGIADFQVNTPGSIFNEDPKFVDYAKWNFRLKEGSPAINKGLAASGLTLFDLDRKPRDQSVDIGCYEYKP